jgi:O-acetyl-ADP-ribose deacetylase (regulator of RNase III)
VDETKTMVTLGSVTLECVVGDIASQLDVEAVVNAANARLLPGGGVAGALHRAAGPGLLVECMPLAPIRPGQAVLTGGHDLPNRHVIHCLGPVYGVDEPADTLLAACYENALRLADAHGLVSVAFPSISTGSFGYPQLSAAKVALAAVVATAPTLTTVRRIRFVLRDTTGLQTYRGVLSALLA